MPLLALLVLLLAACLPREAVAPASAPETIAVTATPVPLDPRDPSRAVVGRLRYMGGLHLTSPDRRFGGLSGLRWHDGTLFAVSDQGDFFRLTLEERDERLTGVSDVRVRRLARPDGRPLGGKEEGDAEALDLHLDEETCGPAHPCLPDTAVVAFEGSNRLWAYRLVDGLPEGPPTELDWSSAWRRGLPANGGVEAMAGGYLLSEELREPDGRASGRLTRWFRDAGMCTHGPCPGPRRPDWTEETPMNLPVADGFSPTDADMADFLLDYPIFVLQRRYTPAEGAAARIVWFHQERDVVGAHVPGRVAGLQTLAELAPPLSVDNMEGLAYRGMQGHFLYVISDDNFSPRQRTLLLKFQLVDPLRR